MRSLAWSVWGVATILSIVGVSLIPLTHHLRHYHQLMPPSMQWIALPLEMLSSAVFLIYASVGLLLRLRQPQNPMGIWALAIALAGGLNTLSGNYTLIAYLIAPGQWWPLAPVAAWTEHWMTLAATAIGGIYIALLFPNGCLPSPGWRPFFVLTSATLLTQLILLAFGQMDILNYAEGYGIANPFGLWRVSLLETAVVLTVAQVLAVAWFLRGFRYPEVMPLTLLFVALTWLSALTGIDGLLIALILIGVALSLVQRLRNTSGVEQQKIKWLAWSFSLVAVFGAGRILSGGQLTVLGNLFYFAFTLGWVLVAVALGFALLQFRLYDIDIIIRRTLVYTSLSGILVAIYWAMVLLLQIAFSDVAGQASPIAIVLSTLAIAALFTPLRSRVQEAIDRRFYRKKYDAQQVLASFAITARDETDMSALTAELARVVDETLQPEYISVLLFNPDRDGVRRQVLEELP